MNEPVVSWPHRPKEKEGMHDIEKVVPGLTDIPNQLRIFRGIALALQSREWIVEQLVASLSQEDPRDEVGVREELATLRDLGLVAIDGQPQTARLVLGSA